MAGKKIAALIGINNYEHCGLLNFAVQDVEALRDILIDPQRGGYQAEYVKLLTDKESPHPHRANILETVSNIAQGASTEDRILVYFAGHGLTHDDEAYLVPIEGYPNNASQTCISIKWLQDQLEHSKASIRLMILDACHSGLEIGRSASGFMTPRFEAALQNLSESGGIAVLSSCKANQASLEDSNLAHGVFSYYLTEGLKGPADTDRDYDISILEAYDYVSSNVKEWAIRHSKLQTPTLFAKITGEINLVTVPKPPTQKAKSSVAVISKITFGRVEPCDAYAEYDSDSYTSARKSASERCLESIGEIGVIIAKLYEPEKIAAVNDMNRSYPGGTFGGSVFDDNGQFAYRLYVQTGSDALENQPFLDEILKRLTFPNLEFELMSPVNLANSFRLAQESGLDVTSFNPPLELKAETWEAPHFSLRVKNTTTSATITVHLNNAQSFEKAVSLIVRLCRGLGKR